MAEYIEREQAYQIAKPIVDYIHSDKYHPVNLGVVIMDMIDDIPSADVVPVVHGHWMEQKIFTEDSGFKNPIVCSCCGSISVADLYGELFLTNYCPSCGARMVDGDES